MRRNVFMESFEQSKKRKASNASLCTDRDSTGAYSKDASEQIMHTQQGSFEMPDKEFVRHSALSTQGDETISSNASSFPYTPRVLAIKVFFGNEYCIFRANSETQLKQVLAEAAEFWNVSISQYIFVDENDWIVSLREKAEALLHNDLKRTLSNEETTNNTGISAECIQLWLVEKDKKKRKACQQNTNKKNFLLPSIRTPLFSKSSTWWKEVHEVSPIFRFPMKGDYGLTEKAKKDEEKIGSQNETNGSLSISEVDSNQPNQSGEEVAKLLVSLHPQNRNSEWRENVGARTDSTLSRNSLPRAAVNQPTQRNNISPSLKTQIDALFIMEDDKALCHICGQRDWNNPWLIRCKIEECSMLYHPDCVKWIPFDAVSMLYGEEQLWRIALNSLSDWKCPKHQCLECGDDTSPLATCTRCTTSYCSKHVPPSVRPQQMSPYEWQQNSEKKSRKIVCDICLDKETKEHQSARFVTKMDVEQEQPFPVCFMNLETIMLPAVEPRAVEFPWFATHLIHKKQPEMEGVGVFDKVHKCTIRELEASSDSTIGYSERRPNYSEASSVPSQKRPYVRRVSPESLKKNDFDFRLNDGTFVKLGPLLNMKLTDDDVAAGLTNNRVLQAAFIILRDEKKPLDARALAERASERGFHCLSLMPNNTFSSQIYRNMKRKKEHSAFYKVNNGEFGLKIWLQAGSTTDKEDGGTNKETTEETLSHKVQE